MKKILITMLMVFASTLFFAQTYTVSLWGTVVDEDTGEPIEQTPVWIMTDSTNNFFYYNMVTTDADGNFEDIIEVDEGIEGVLFVSTSNCDGTVITEILEFGEGNAELETILAVCGIPTGDDCEADFYAYPDSDDGLTLQFMDSSYGFPTNWEWDFGDGANSTEQNPLHTFPDVGEYTEYLVSLSISDDSSGCTSYIERIVGVGDSIIWLPDSCMAMFYAYPESNNWLTMQFMDVSFGFPTDWEWDFGDGNSSAEQNPVHTFPEFGEYMVTLTISSDSMDCNSSVIMPVIVGDSIWFPDSCMAMFFACPDTSDFMTLHFLDMSFGEDGNAPTNWYWEFGDGTSSEEQNPYHTYAEEGIYEVCLTISDDNENCTSTYCETVEVIDWDAYCQAQFFYYPAFDSTGNGDGLSMQFMDYSYGNPTSWIWDFGDGGTSEEQNPIHSFDEVGIYDVCLTIANPVDSCESTLCQEVYVINDTIIDCFGWFEYEMDEMTVDFAGYLNNTNTGNYSWDFGDGNSGTGQTVTHTYAEDGIYPVTMTVIDSASGCFSTYVDMLWVGEDFSFDVEGYIYLDDSNSMADYATVYLMTFDTIGENLINVAETEIDENGYYIFEDVSDSNCIYFVQADLTETSAYYGEYVPTYHYNALIWEDAWPVFPFPMGYSYDVYLIPTQTMNVGSGLITGNVGYESDRSGIENVNMLLLDIENTPYTYRKTDEAGEFDFSELPYGTYVVHAEIMNIHTIPVTIEITENTQEVNIDIVVKNGEAVLGIGDRQSAFIDEVGEVYPNPVIDQAAIQVSLKQKANLQYSILNNYGQVLTVNENNFSAGKYQIDLAIDHLPKGIYFISVKANDGIATVKKLVKL